MASRRGIAGGAAPAPLWGFPGPCESRRSRTVRVGSRPTPRQHPCPAPDPRAWAGAGSGRAEGVRASVSLRSTNGGSGNGTQWGVLHRDWLLASGSFAPANEQAEQLAGRREERWLGPSPLARPLLQHNPRVSVGSQHPPEGCPPRGVPPQLQQRAAIVGSWWCPTPVVLPNPAGAQSPPAAAKKPRGRSILQSLFCCLCHDDAEPFSVNNNAPLLVEENGTVPKVPPSRTPTPKWGRIQGHSTTVPQPPVTKEGDTAA